MAWWLLLLACAPPDEAADGRRGPEIGVPTKSTTSEVTPTVLPTLTVPEPLVTRVDLPDMVVPELLATPPASAFVGTVEVSLAASDPEASIWYTLDGTAPQVGGSTPYTGPFVLDRSTPVRAVAEVFGQPLGIAPTYLALEPSLEGFASDVPLVVLWTLDTAPATKSDTYTRFTLTTFEPTPGLPAGLPGESTLSVLSGLRVRGSSSAGFPKRPYRLETWDPLLPGGADLDVPLLGMAPDADWVLLSPLVFDRALMRNALVYRLSNLIGRYAPDTRFAEVFVAERGEAVGLDDYQGVYVVVERIERGTDRVAITRLEPTDTVMPELSGGYLFKEDRLGTGDRGFTAGTAGGRLAFQQPFVAVEPNETELAPGQLDYLVTELDELGEALVSPGFVHPVTGRPYDQIVDVDSFIDHHILNVFAKNPDAFRLSGYFHKDREALLQSGPVWDFDRTMGCADDTRAADPQWWDASNETSDCTYVFEHGFWLGLFADPAFTDRYWARWEELLGAELSLDAVLAEIDAMEAELADAGPRNAQAWPDYPPRGGSFAAEVELLRDWVRVRHAWAEGCLALPDPSRCEG